MSRIVVTIDGPAGSGKTTISRLLADRLGYTYIDTGALYRGVALAAVEAGAGFDDDAALKDLCKGMDLSFVRSDSGLRLLSSGRDISEDIRKPEISMAASAVSARPVVRAFLFGLQRKLGDEKGAVFEGRDMGTVVFPEAEMKFFLTASVKTRAMRRYVQAGEGGGQTLEEVEADIMRRDENDSSRSVAPLKQADDAVFVDSTDLGIEGVLGMMMESIKKAGY